MKRILSILLACMMVLSLAACGAKEETTVPTAEPSTSNANTSTTITATADTSDVQSAVDSIFDLEGTIFPLAEPMTFKITTSGYRYGDIRKISECEDFMNLCEATNVFFDFDYVGDYDAAETKTSLQMRLMNGDYGDALWSFYLDNLTKDDIDELADSGIVISLDDYLFDPDVMPNFNKNVLNGHDYLLKNMKSNNGHINAFYGISETACYTANEGLMQVNEEWLNSWETAKGINHSPETIEEFEDMLLFFRDSDLNGNGEKDEIAYFIAQNTFNGTASLEASMGMYGIGIKDSAADMNIMINDDGECYYVYTTDAYKEGLKTFSKWYSEDLIWKEVFTGNAETIAEVCSKAKDSFGVINTCYDLEGFVALMPPSVPGYPAHYHTHPSVRSGIEGQPFGVITDKCEHPEVLAAFLDLSYDYINHLKWRYGNAAFEDGRITVDDSGIVVFDLQKYADVTDYNGGNPISNYLWYVNALTIDNLAKTDTESYFGNRACALGYEMYEEKNLWNPTENLWPRCSIVEESADDYAFMYTDVSTTVAEYRARFLTGDLDVDKDWDEFQNKLQTLGIEEMRDIIQASYDAYLAK